MEIICLTVGDLSTHCYLVTDESTRETIIIDPGDEGDFISTTIIENKLIPKAVVLTHGHYDHCLAALELKLNFHLPLYLHSKDTFLYDKAHITANHFSHISIPKLPPIDHFLNDKDVLTFGESSLKIIHTPGHTPGSCCFLTTCHSGPASQQGGLDPESSLQYLLTGDTLFISGPGSTDHSYSSQSTLLHSLAHLSSEVPDLRSTLLYPGHEDYGLSLTSDYLSATKS